LIQQVAERGFSSAKSVLLARDTNQGSTMMQYKKSLMQDFRLFSRVQVSRIEQMEQ
jgi:hypothetical protein